MANYLSRPILKTSSFKQTLKSRILYAAVNVFTHLRIRPSRTPDTGEKSGNGGEDDCEFVGENLLEYGNAEALFPVQYRLSSCSVQNAFPAALQDAVTGYLFLLNELEIPAHLIMLAGDSAGGNLTIAVLRYISEHGAELNVPSPKCCALFSPWTPPLRRDLEEPKLQI
ncbi:hypothetical protein F4678DRAFT_485354 [Xylaria arbuscula]|nr:hypothetical protein F4678DRAFT_485354 [Xylaria arbuscula]